jgi:outer membrane protein OmpA-like peptidoglycan-associated protein
MAIATAGLDAWAADGYAPPPLFVSPPPLANSKPAPVMPAVPPVAPNDLDRPIAQTAKPPMPPPPLTLPRPTAAMPAPLPSTNQLAGVAPPPNDLPIDNALSVDELLYHPGTRVDAPARAAMAEQQSLDRARPPGRAQPILENPPAPQAATKDSIAPTPARPVAAVKPPAKPAPSKAAVATLAKPKQPERAVAKAKPAPQPSASTVAAAAAVEPSAQADEQGSPFQETIKTPPAPRPAISTPEPTIRRIIKENPKVMVYSRDAETGEFKRMDPKDRIIRNQGRTSEFSATPKPDTVNTTATPPKPSSLPPASQADRQASPAKVAGAIAAGIPPLMQDDLAEVLESIKAEEMKLALAAPQAQDLSAPTPPPPPTMPAKHALKPSTPPTPKASTTPTDAPTNTAKPVRLAFAVGKGDLPDALMRQLDDTVLPAMSQNNQARAEIRAFATLQPDTPMSDRRVALARGLAVREYLKSQGIESERLVLRALGSNGGQDYGDWVDIVLQ